MAHRLARVAALPPPPAHALAAELLLSAAPLLPPLAAVAGRVHHERAGRAGARVAEERAGVRAAAGQLPAAQLAARVGREPPAEEVPKGAGSAGPQTFALCHITLCHSRKCTHANKATQHVWLEGAAGARVEPIDGRHAPARHSRVPLWVLLLAAEARVEARRAAGRVAEAALWAAVLERVAWRRGAGRVVRAQRRGLDLVARPVLGMGKWVGDGSGLFAAGFKRTAGLTGWRLRLIGLMQHP